MRNLSNTSIKLEIYRPDHREYYESDQWTGLNRRSNPQEMARDEFCQGNKSSRLFIPYKI